VVPGSVYNSSDITSEGESYEIDETSWSTDPPTDSNEDSDLEAKLYAIDVLSQMVSESMPHLEDPDIIPTMKEELPRMIKFGPILLEQEHVQLETLVIKYVDLFVSKHLDLPAITLDEHRIELIPNAKLVCEKQKRKAPDRMVVLRVELDRLLEGGFVTEVKNTKWVFPVVIVPKKGGK